MKIVYLSTGYRHPNHAPGDYAEGGVAAPLDTPEIVTRNSHLPSLTSRICGCFGAVETVGSNTTPHNSGLDRAHSSLRWCGGTVGALIVYTCRGLALAFLGWTTRGPRTVLIMLLVPGCRQEWKLIMLCILGKHGLV